MSKIRKSAKGQACMVRIPGVCNFNPETTVLAHMNGGGMGRKNPDFQSAFSCSACHSALDGHTQTGFTKDELKLFHLEGIMRTQQLLFDCGMIETKGSK